MLIQPNYRQAIVMVRLLRGKKTYATTNSVNALRYRGWVKKKSDELTPRGRKLAERFVVEMSAATDDTEYLD